MNDDFSAQCLLQHYHYCTYPHPFPFRDLSVLMAIRMVVAMLEPRQNIKGSR
jgi:hypothetical protein